MGYTIETVSGVGGKAVRTKEKVSKDKEKKWKSVMKKVDVKVSEEQKKKKKKKSFLSKRLVSKPILKRSKTTVVVKEHEPAPYESRFFKDRFEEDKRRLFFN